MVTAQETFEELIQDPKKFCETLLVIENRERQVVPFKFNPIQVDVHNTQTGTDIWVKPSSVGFSTERIATRLVDTPSTGYVDG